MRKLIVGLVIALIVVAGSYFGLEYWAARAAIHEVDAALDQWRASAGTATRGPVEVNLWTRGVRVRDVVLTSRTAPDDKVTIAEVVASGVDRSGRADRLVLLGLETSGAVPGMPGARMTQTSPRIMLTGYAGRPLVRRGGPTVLDTMRMWLEHFSAIAAETVEIPTLTVTVALAATVGPQAAPVSAEYTYSNVLLRGVAKGRIAEATVDRIDLRSDTGGRAFTGEIGKTSITDVDLGPMLALLDPSRPKAEGYHRMYGALSAGPYTLRFGDGTGFSIDRIAAEDIGLYPGKLSLDDLLFLTEVGNTGGKPPTPAQLGMLMDKLGGLYEAIRFGRIELKGMRGEPKGPEQISVGSIALSGLDNGRFAEIAIERIEAKAPAAKEALINVGRMSFKGLHVANLFRTMAAQLALQAGPRQPRDPTQMLRALALIEGMQIADMTMPEPTTGRMVQLQALDASWGKPVEGIPSEVRLSAKVRVPVSATDTEPFMRALAARGVPAMSASLDFGSTWTEATQTVAVAPATLEMGDVMAMSLKAVLGNVPREVFSPDIVKAIGSAVLVEVGPVELTVRDLGMVDQAAADLGRTAGGGPEAGRILLAATLAQSALAATQKRPELRPFFDALSQFVQRKGAAITVSLTPKGRVGVLDLIEGARRDPLAALLDGFTLDTKTGG